MFNIAEPLRLSPANFVLDPSRDEVEVPWVVQGAMMFSLLGAHVQASLLHGSQDLAWRVETAMCGCLFGLFRYEFEIVWLCLAGASML